jgi:hypothetical protein
MPGGSLRGNTGVTEMGVMDRYPALLTVPNNCSVVQTIWAFSTGLTFSSVRGRDPSLLDWGTGGPEFKSRRSDHSNRTRSETCEGRPKLRTPPVCRPFANLFPVPPSETWRWLVPAARVHRGGRRVRGRYGRLLIFSTGEPFQRSPGGGGRCLAMVVAPASNTGSSPISTGRRAAA